MYFYGSQGKTVIAGNSFGVDIHGNSFGAGQLTKLVHHFDHDDTCEARFGSDFNGVSDALEANTVADSVLFDIDSTSTTNSHWVSMRGNSLTNTATPFASRPPIGDGQTSSDGQDVYANFIDITGINGALDIIPIIGAGTTTTSLTGACGKPAAAPYTRLVVDLYEADPAPSSPPQGMKWLASFTDNSHADSDPAVGSFTFDTTALAIAHGTKLTIAVTYSKDTKPAITTITRTGSLTSLTVTNSTGPNFGIQKSSTVNGAYAYTAVAANGSASFTDTNNPASFYRATGPSATGQTSPFSDVFTVP